MRYPFTASQTSISLFFDGRMHSVSNTHPSFRQIADHLRQPQHDTAILSDLIDVPTLVNRITEGAVTVQGSTVYYRGIPLHTTVAKKLTSVMADGYDVTGWAQFIDKLMANPSERSRECLYEFLIQFDAPITEDGNFIAFKRVTSDYRDIYTGSMDNSPGTIVEVDRSDVDDDPRHACSRGLHACAMHYLNSAYCRGDNKRTVAVEISPEDVVSVPEDYNFSKMRVCRYKVLGDVADTGAMSAATISNSSMFVGTESGATAPSYFGRSIDEVRIDITFEEYGVLWAESYDDAVSVGDWVVDANIDIDDQFRIGLVTDEEWHRGDQIVTIRWDTGDQEELSSEDVFAVTPRSEDAFISNEDAALFCEVCDERVHNCACDDPDETPATLTLTADNILIDGSIILSSKAAQQFINIGGSSYNVEIFKRIAASSTVSEMVEMFGCSIAEVANALIYVEMAP